LRGTSAGNDGLCSLPQLLVVTRTAMTKRRRSWRLRRIKQRGRKRHSWQSVLSTTFTILLQWPGTARPYTYTTNQHRPRRLPILTGTSRELPPTTTTRQRRCTGTTTQQQHPCSFTVHAQFDYNNVVVTSTAEPTVHEVKQ
jgi:hypothetical protein